MKRLVPALMMSLMASAGCDPCAGVGSCSDPAVRFDGEVETLYPRGFAEDVAVEFTGTGGVRLQEDTYSARTGSNGRFRIEAQALEEGEVVGRLTFYPPEPLQPVSFDDVRIRTSRDPGEVRFAGSWKIPFPHLPYEAHFYSRATGKPAPMVEVEFRRTGGIRVEPDTFRVTTDAFGNIKLRPLAMEVGELRGELLVYPLPPFEPFRIGDLRMTTFVEERFDSTLVRTGIGPHVPYAGVLRTEATGIPATEFELEFVRTGGVAIQPDPFRTRPDSFGTFHVNPFPLEGSGNVEGYLVVRSPAPYTGLVLRTLVLAVQSGDHPILHIGHLFVPRR